MTINRLGLALTALALGACIRLAPSLPFSPAAVAAPDRSTFIATVGCERPILGVRLLGGGVDFWRIESDDPEGSPLSTVRIGVVPAGFTEVIPLDPAWADNELFERSGATITFEAPEEEPGLEDMGVFVPSTPGYGWLFGDDRDGPGSTWDAYRSFVTDEREVGGNACAEVIPEP